VFQRKSHSIKPMEPSWDPSLGYWNRALV